VGMKRWLRGRMGRCRYILIAFVARLLYV